MNNNFDILSLEKDVSIIIRHVNERTLNISKVMAENEVGVQNVFLVTGIPFEKTLFETYKLAVSLSSKWIMTLDADVILKKGSVKNLLNFAETLPEHFFQVEGLIYDKLLNNYREAGHRIYRKSLLNQALNLFSNLDNHIRPERQIIKLMSQKGFPSFKTNIVSGIHDFEQFYKDIYRKCFVHAQKHQYLIGGLISNWSKLQYNDLDYKVAIAGAWDGLTKNHNATIDISVFEDYYKSFLYPFTV